MVFDLKKICKSFVFAFKGIFQAYKSEQNFRFHIIIIPLVIAAGFYLQLTPASWGLIIISIFFVLISELWNTAIEKLCDLTFGLKRDQGIAVVKDIAAGAVLLTAVNAVIIGIILIAWPLIRKVSIYFFK